MAVLRVPRDYATIQKATVAARPGDTIVADAGYSKKEYVKIGTDGLTVGADEAARQITLELQGKATHLTLTGKAPITAYGSEKGSVIRGNAGDNVIEARSSAADTIDGGDGIDVIVTDNAFFSWGGADRLSGGKGDDRFQMGGFAYDGAVIDGGDGIDTLEIGTLSGLTVKNVEVLDGDGHSGTIAQFRSFQKYTVSDSPLPTISLFLRGVGGTLDFTSSVSGNLGVSVRATSLTSGVTVTGSHNGDTFYGSAYDDVFNGGDGDDFINTGDGIDILNGDAGNDTFFLDLVSSGIGRIDGGTGTDTVMVSGSLLDYEFHNVEILRTSDAGGTLEQYNSFKTISYDNSIIHNIGLTLLGGGGTIDFSTKIGGTNSLSANGRQLVSAVTIIGSSASDALTGSAFDDRLDGWKGADQLWGGQGDDTFIVDNRGDRVVEKVGEGIDTVLTKVSYALQAGQEIERLSASDRAGNAALHLTGNEFGQTIRGTNGDNQLDGKGGADALYGYGGNDTYLVDNWNDRVVEAGGGGRDTVIASRNYKLGAGQEIETLQLAATSKAGYTLIGNAFDNALIGNAGADKLEGGLGDDLLKGGAGRDSFIFASALGAGNVDHISDFAHGIDTVRLAKGIFTALGAGHLTDDAFKDLGVAGATVDADDRILYDHNTGALSYDADGSGTAFAAIRFAVVDNHGRAHLDHADILIV
ncbi:calcium-binding protein [Methylorubrum sp. SB2]|uniref:calcium-binding protein n=1 Tax=Methylorubrum subtropicum TaxID=3138812 RepID=UPI00313D7981